MPPRVATGGKQRPRTHGSLVHDPLRASTQMGIPAQLAAGDTAAVAGVHPLRSLLPVHLQRR